MVSATSIFLYCDWTPRRSFSEFQFTLIFGKFLLSNHVYFCLIFGDQEKIVKPDSLTMRPGKLFPLLGLQPFGEGSACNGTRIYYCLDV